MKSMKLAAACLLIIALISGCGSPSGMEGIWEEEIRVSILGAHQDGGDIPATVRISFREDGSGTWETRIHQDSHPPAQRDFSYTLEADRLTLRYEEDAADTVFSVTMEGNVLALENSRGSFRLTRVK